MNAPIALIKTRGDLKFLGGYGAEWMHDEFYACALLNHRTTCSLNYTCIFTTSLWSEFGLAEQSSVAAEARKDGENSAKTAPK